MKLKTKLKPGLALAATALASLLVVGQSASAAEKPIVHDAEYYILDAQHGEQWKVQDKDLDAKLEELKKKFGRTPNIVNFMWDDQPFGAVGIPAMQPMRGYSTPNLNKMAAEGMLFTRMYSEPSCTPSRAALMTGQTPFRNGMSTVGMPIENKGLSKNTVSIANVLSKAGYATAFFGKWHLGDIEQSYPYNQGFDEAFFNPYNQIASLWNVQGEGAGAVEGMFPEILAKDPYELDKKFIQKGMVLYIEGKKGEQGKEWGATQTPQDFATFDQECAKRAMTFMATSAAQKKPFYVAWWPMMMPFFPLPPPRASLQRGLAGEAYTKILDPMAGKLMAFLQEKGLAENTLVIAMADNGPMTHNPPAGSGLGEGPFRGGKGEVLEGGVRVCAQAWWPGVIKPGQIVNDIVQFTDLYTTFAHIGGALDHVPTDRIIDGIDQTSLMLNGDTFGRRDYVFLYAGPKLGAVVKKQYKFSLAGGEGASSGIPAGFFDLYNDPREATPLLIQMIHMKEPFDRMMLRHQLWMKKYPNQPAGKGPAFTGLSNARPETVALSEPPLDFKKLPFDPLEYIDHKDELPFFTDEPDLK